MFHKITSLAKLSDYVLFVGFSDGQYRKFDLKPLINKYPPFTALEKDGIYYNAKIDIGGYGIVFDENLDISAEGIYEQGVPCLPSENIEEAKNQLIREIIKYRKRIGISQKQLEIISGIAQPCIARTEKGTTDPKLSTLLRMIEPLGLKLSISENKDKH